MTTTNSYGSRGCPSHGIERYAWLFMRLSGLALLILAIGHLFIMHVFNSVHNIDYNFVSARYERMFWRVYDMAMLWLALIHGMNGLRTIVDDYTRGAVRVWVVRSLYIVGIALLALGSWVIIFFQPVAKAGGMH
jgi:succinate dehydrogenase / fumarate reductase membrane anchor subunit